MEVRGVGLEISDGGIFVENFSDAMAGKLANDRIAITLDDFLNQLRKFTYREVGTKEVDSRTESYLGGLDHFADFVVGSGGRTDRYGYGGVRMKTFVVYASIDFQ